VEERGRAKEAKPVKPATHIRRHLRAMNRANTSMRETCSGRDAQDSQCPTESQRRHHVLTFHLPVVERDNGWTNHIKVGLRHSSSETRHALAAHGKTP
jgi:hypothetical protein